MDDAPKIEEFESEVETEDGTKERFRVSRIHVGQPRDEQDRAGLILARAQQWIARIKDKYLLLVGSNEPHAGCRDRIEEAFAALVRVTDIAHDWMTGDSQFRDLDGNLVMSLFDGIVLGDYYSLLQRLYALCDQYKEHVAQRGTRSEADLFFINEMGALRGELEDHQQDYERRGFYMDISSRVRSGDLGQEEGQPTYHEDDPVVPEGGGPVEAEPPKKKAKKKVAKKKAKKRKRRQK